MRGGGVTIVRPARQQIADVDDERPRHRLRGYPLLRLPLENLKAAVLVLPQQRDAAEVGMYHTLNSKNDTEPFVMPYSAFEKVFCDFYESKKNVSTYVESTERMLDSVPKGRDLTIRILYKNKAKGTKLKVKLRIDDASGKEDNKAMLNLYNTILKKKR